MIQLLNNLYGQTAYVSLVQNATDRDSTALVFKNLSSTITSIEYAVLTVVIMMALLIILLISLLVINDNKYLASLMKALGYRDHKNIISFLSIYAPVILISVGLSIPMGLLLVSIFNSVVFGTAGIFLTSKLT
jgi:ABC-type uncharacterized transport system fused permease/ATPase subunit